MTYSRANHCKKYGTDDIPYIFAFLSQPGSGGGGIFYYVRLSLKQKNRLFNPF